MSLPPPPPGFTVDGGPRPAPRAAPRRRREDEEDAPAPPEGFTLDQPPPPVVPPRVPAPSLALDSIVSARDGDTLRTSSGASIRLPGVDAPELKQQGWDRRGQPVPIGQQSQQWIADAIQKATAVIGQPVGQSYGRTVAPVTLDGMDLGQTAARFGQALAAPRYLPDPQQRYEAMQAERLARQNGLGLHDTFMQPPEQYRRAPMAAPSRETVAQFWDTPTPMAGLRPEDEQAFLGMANDLKVPVAQVVQYARDHGFTVDPANVEKSRSAVAKSGIPAAAEYRDRIKPLTDLGDGTAGAVARGVANGAVPNMLEELGAVPDTLGMTPGRENVWNSDRRLADIYSNNLTQNEAIIGHDRLAHPWATTASEVAGGFIMPAGRVRSVGDLAKFGAGYGAVAGLGQDGTIPERLASGVVGAGEGLALTVAGGKALEAAVRNAPRLGRYVAQRFRRGAPEAPAGPVESIVGPSIDDVTDGTVPAPPEGFTLDAQPMAGDPGASVSSAPRQRDYIDLSRPIRMDQGPTEAQLAAMAERIDPRDVVPIPSNEVGSVEEAAAREAGRFVEAKPPNERAELTRQTVRGINGPVPKVGPIDMVGWLRLNGGLREQGGGLSAMGLNNAARRMDFAGQEGRFGPLVHDQGRPLDDAAQAAWEAGYFPELTERPDVNAFLGALRDTYEGRGRRFLPDDQPELDRFHATQRDRYDLEQQQYETGQPVWHDNSVPANEPQPLPPVQAYEEWPAGGPDFAGNIDLRKLESPQDIVRALSTVNNRVGFDAATRGRVTHAETERLAADLNMTPETLLSRRKGSAFNAEEALAARQILAKSGNELVNAAKRIQSLDDPGDEMLADFQEKLLRHVGIQEAVSGMTAEAGRSLQQFRMAASSRAVRGDVLASLVRSGGGKDRMQDAAQILIDAIEESPGKFNADAMKVANPRMRDKLTELWINSLLSGPQTHAVNIASNTLTALAQIPEHATAAVIGAARQAVPGASIDRIVGSEVGARVFGLIQGAKEGARLFAQSVKTGEPSDLVSKVEGQGMKAISGIKGEVVRAPTRMLTAEDEFFKGIARRMELNGLAVRQAHKEGLRGEAAKARIAELVANPPDEMFQSSMDYARYVTFQSKLGPLASKVSGMTQDAPVLKLFLPFVRTPTNLLKFAVERSPAAPLLKEWRQDFMAGGSRRDLAAAKAMLGTGLGAAIYQAALEGKVTGSAPSDPAKSRLMYADGWQPYSIRIGDQWVSYKRMDPFSTTLGVAADLATMPAGMNERQRDDMATLLVGSILGNLANKTWLSGLSDMIGALSEPDRKADRLVQRLVGSITVPTGVAQVARTLDPVQRETETVGEAIQARIPGLSQSLQPRLDVWGQPVTNEGGVGPDLISPAWVSTTKNDPVNRELMQAGASVGMVPGKVGGVTLTPEQKARYQAASGQKAHAGLQELVGSPQWRGLDSEGRQDAAAKVIRDARAAVRAGMFGGTKGAPRKTSAAPPPPPGFALDGEAGGVNVFADLQRAIPGVRFTSGFRTPEYQEDMRRRGYKPAANSGHLSGSDFDMLPPPGKSLAWLKAAVAKAQPGARLSIHDGHLHGSFPGYYGAPVLGGAKAKGIRNPNAGMPPPPPGFRLDR